VLNGGFRSWFLASQPTSFDRPKITRTTFEVRAVRSEMCATKDDVKSAIDRGDTVIWDVRAADEYAGEDKRANKHGGHIPGAVNMEWLTLQQPPVRSGLLLPADEMRAKLEALGVTPDKHVITHCQAGIRAAQAYFILRLLGYPSAANYDASWAEWGNVDDTPIVK
jgi:thiosulfate/3-mercaptopyruvate sulfurtransferase